MNPQSPGTGGRGPYDSWGRPQGASQQSGPQQPGPEYVYEMPEDFQEQQQGTWQDSANGNAKGHPRGAKPAPDAPGCGLLVSRVFGQPHSRHVGQGFPEDVPVD